MFTYRKQVVNEKSTNMPEQTIYNVFTYRMEREISAFGTWIREKRTEQGLSMRDLAERTNGACSHSYIGQIETGRAGKKGLFRPSRLCDHCGHPRTHWIENVTALCS